VIAAGTGLGLLVYAIVMIFSLPIFLFYGFIGGLGNPMVNLGVIVLTLGGALAAKTYFMKVYGSQDWRRYAMVITAGYGCGTGLIAMFGVAVALIAKSISQLPF